MINNNINQSSNSNSNINNNNNNDGHDNNCSSSKPLKPFSFQYGYCKRCGNHHQLLMHSNNILDNGDDDICFDCISELLNYNNIEHADYFCRRYNLPLLPDLWIKLAEESGKKVFELYTKTIYDDAAYQPNLAYQSTTADIWKKVNKEWEKKRSFAEVLSKLSTIQESYVDRGRLKWGSQYSFEELLKLDSIYSRTLKANRITNPLQKEAVKTLCKLQIEMDEAIKAKDAKAIRDFSSAWSTFADQADLETMINETKTDDITTVAELYDYMEKSGFQFRFYDGFPKDEVDTAIKDIQDTNRRLILESTGLQQTLEDMMRQRQENLESSHTKEITQQESLQDLLDFHPTDMVVDSESDDAALNEQFDDASEGPTPTKVIPKGGDDKSC